MPSLLQRLRALWQKPQPPAVLASPQVAPPPGTPAPRHVANPSDPLRPLDEESVYQALRNCYDPEIPVNIVDLGLIYDVHIADGRVDVKMTLTTQGCGMGGHIAGEAEEQLRTLPGVREAAVEIVWEPPWTPNMISAAGRKRLGLPEG
ncbi:MAG TPA: iron-sulfur cluster assembly protein [Candidatus Binatia bacterium]|nr:iron-sulfur cluster assembly protein [Candidatus Binatia bacterium]